jgi:hypothetical protein
VASDRADPAQLNMEPHIGAFLLARIDEAEKAARICQVEQALTAAWIALHEMTDPPAGIKMALKYAIQHDPARVLVECSAKRRIVELHEVFTDGDDSSGREWCRGCRDGFPCDTLRLLALPYDEYPGYQEGWRL